MKLLVTGASGFVGHYAMEMIAGSIALPASVDLRKSRDIAEALGMLQFDSVLHLAGQSSVQEAFRDPLGTFDTNFNGTFNLLTALEARNSKCRVLTIGSGDMYGALDPDELPIRETNPLRPRNPYAVSKVAAEALGYQMSQSVGLDIVMARSFNHIGPGQSEHFAVSSFAKQIVEMKLKLREPVLNVGDLTATRDVSDVRDVVRAYELLLRRGRSGEIYNVCSARDVSMRTIVDRLCAIAGVRCEIRVETSRLRPTDSPRVQGSNEKILKATGWKPQIDLEQSLKDMLDYWETKLR